MKTILVSLVSEQTIPNILAIHHFKPDESLFVSTKEMEKKGKTSAILKTLERLGLRYESAPVIVQEDSILDCHKKIYQRIEGNEDVEFIVNLTGGTKIMSIAAYEFFKDYGSKMIYIPIPKNEFITPFPKKSTSNPVPLSARLTVAQYLTAYGLKVSNEEKLKKYHEEALARKDIAESIIHSYEEVKKLLVWLSGNLGQYRGKKKFGLVGSFEAAHEKEAQLLSRLAIDYDGHIVSKNLEQSEIRYLTGGWLEEFCFVELLQWVGRGIDDAVMGLQLKDARGRNNEFDIMFTRDNSLYFVECKSLDQQHDKNADALYKIGALQKEFGLKVASFFVTTSPHVLKEGKIRESVQARADQFKTTIVPPSQVTDFGRIIAQKLHIEKGNRVD
ncbi:MAG: DUF1887 family CARF protein [Deltaproteobacteria bacterium]|nr:DUF1887 family CARF protein [Deltaproteobacteria bacterium]